MTLFSNQVRHYQLQPPRAFRSFHTQNRQPSYRKSVLPNSEAGSRAWGGRIKNMFLWELLLLFGRFGVLVMTLFLRKKQNVSFMHAILKGAYWLRF